MRWCQAYGKSTYYFTRYKGLLGSPFFMRNLKGDVMKPICPNCHSANVSCSESLISPSKIAEQLCSQTALSSLGISICKYYKVNPAVGAIAGTAMATAISLVVNKVQPPLLSHSPAQAYLCHTCFKPFTL